VTSALGGNRETQISLVVAACGPSGFWPIRFLVSSRREIPSFRMQWLRVVGLTPSFLAAPLGPPTTQPTCCRVRKSRARCDSRSVVAVGGINTGSAESAKGFESRPSFESTTARWIAFCSSRMFADIARPVILDERCHCCCLGISFSSRLSQQGHS
jgi:hypothetical protein